MLNQNRCELVPLTISVHRHPDAFRPIVPVEASG